jgi:ATP-dependent DNA ligase
MPPVKPMLAKIGKLEQALDMLDSGHGQIEPKWDGFRCIVFRDGSEVELGSRNERPLTRYFPEVVSAVLEQFPARCVIDR